jgi:hypothetical protein
VTVVPQQVRDRLPKLEGLRVLLLGTSAETAAELTADGALVTLASERVAASGELAIVQSDPAHLPTELLRARFDLVYVERGGLRGDLGDLAAGASAALRPLGWLVVYERHPLLRRTYFDTWTLGELVTAIAQAGLSLKRLEEYPAQHDPRLPGEFLLRAEKPE